MYEEMGLNLQRTRFLYEGYTYPLRFVTFERNSELAYYSSNNYTLGFHKSLAYKPKITVLKNIIRHELAHMMTFIRHRDIERSHGKEFQETCRLYGWGKEISEATINLDTANETNEGDVASDKLIAKVQKLLKLASSSNQHESELATLKANELILKFNLDRISMAESEDEDTCVVTAIKFKRQNGKYQAIYEIAKDFCVSPVFNQTRDYSSIDLVGRRENVLIGEYVCQFLDKELDRIWKNAQKTNLNLKGIRAKNSFMLGVANGFKQKREKIVETLTAKELILINRDLETSLRRAFPRLGSKTSSRITDPHSHASGLAAGSKLSINPGVENKKSAPHQLGWNK